jgi:tetratricopeptide (TPR) repeat protein
MEYRAEHKIKKAKEYEKLGKHLHAIQLYRSVINEYPGFIDSFIRLAELYEKSGQLNSAISVYKSALNLNPQSTELAFVSGQFFVKQELWQDAIDTLTCVSPEEEPLVSFLIGFAYFNLEDYEISKMHLLKFIISDEQPELIHQAYLYLAKIEYTLNRFEEGLKFIRKAELLLNDFWELHFIKAKLMYQLKMYSHAVKEIEWAFNLNSKEPLLNLWAGKIFLKCLEYKKAEEHLTNCIEKGTSVSPEVHLELVDAFQKQNKLSEAAEYLDSALLQDPRNLEILKRKKNLSKIMKSNTAFDA